MKKLIGFLLLSSLLVLSLAQVSDSQVGDPTGGSVIVKEADNVPTVNGVRTIIVTNGSLTDNGGGSVTLATSGATGVTIGASTVTGGTASSLLYVGAGPLLQQVSITGLVLGNGAAAPTAYAGSTCTNQAVTALSASAVATCTTLTSAYVNSSIAVTGATNSWGDGFRQTFNPDNTNSGLNVGGNATDPSSPTDGDIIYNSTTPAFRFRENGAWRGLGITAETLDLQGTFALGKVITGANSRANAFRFGDGVTPMCGYTDATLGPMIRPCTDSNILTVIANTFTYKIWDEAGALSMEEIKPSGATPDLMWSYVNAAYRPKGSVSWNADMMHSDGTQCGAPSEVTINSGAKMVSIICANNASSTIYGQVEMPDNYDGGTVTFMWDVIQTAADTNIMNSHIAAACRAQGDAINNTWGTLQTLNIAAVGGSNKKDRVTSAAVTPNGTCTNNGTLLQWRWQLDTSTTTAVATLHNIAVKMEYSIKSRSS